MKVSTEQKAKAAYKEGGVSVLLNTVLFALKLWAGIVTGSIALMADAWHTLSDSLSSIVVLIAARLSRRKPDKDHPFGHGRWEQIAALVIALMLGIIAYQFAADSVQRLQTRQETHFGTIAIVVTIISIVAKEGLAQYAFSLARKTNNVSVKADGWHHRTDALSSVVVLAGIFCAQYFWWIDGALGLIVALMLFYATYEIAKDTINSFLGESPSQELMDEIAVKARTVADGDLQLHHFHIHNYVTHQELTFHIRLDGNMSINEGHEVATRIEQVIRDDYGIDSTIHVEPVGYEHGND